jgi:UDP-sulfoquinovose synthase
VHRNRRQHPAKGELRILNQFTETFSVNDLARRVQSAGRAMGLNVDIQHLDNPRQEREEHYYNPAHDGFTKLGLEPILLTEDVLIGMLDRVLSYRERVVMRRIKPRVRWGPASTNAQAPREPIQV